LYDEIENLEIPERILSGVLCDKIIEAEGKKEKEIIKLKLRKVTFYDRENKREFEFLQICLCYEPI
jgi:hypothetical protein